MRMDLLRIGMKVNHTHHGDGIVRSINELGAEIDFGSERKTIAATDRELSAAEPLINVSGLDSPLPDFVRSSTRMILRELGIEPPDSEPIEGMAKKWHDGTLILKPADESLQAKDVPLDTFFHKIVMMRNNLRVLEQKVNAHNGLTEADKVELQQYITRCYGSMTTFNVLFKDKEDQF